MTALAQLEAALCQAAPHHRSRIRHQLALMDAGLRQFLETYVAHCTQAGASCDDMAESYAFLLRETMKEQMYFAKHGTYRYHTQDDVRDRGYRDDGYMTKYMTGLALSTVLWPNHVALYHFFKRFVESDKCPRGGYMEVGAGHGLFCAQALRSGQFQSCTVVDVSASSIRLSKAMLQDAARGVPVTYHCMDFLDFAAGSYDVIVIGEVLEHVEHPDAFLRKARELLRPGGRVYVSTCLNAPEPDHIYLFSTRAEVAQMIRASGFSVEDEACLPYEGRTAELCEAERLPVNVAYILKPS